MRCAWKELLSILPMTLRQPVDEHGRECLQELRLRLHAPAQLILGKGKRELSVVTTAADLNFVVNAASRYSPWTAASAAKGYITAPGGHRIGLAGEVICREGVITGIKNLTSLCIRIARDFPGIAAGIPKTAGNLLILGAPGTGKTTLLRDLIRQISVSECVAVVDERGELFPPGAMYQYGRQTDILTGCDKERGIDMALRTLGPAWIAMDEITSQSDCRALVQACWSGVKLVATAHAAGVQDLLYRPVYKPLVDTRLFETVIVLHGDKSWKAERMKL